MSFNIPMVTVLADVISKSADRVRDYRDRRVRMTKSDTIRVLILPVLEALGWDLQDVEEVRSEYRHASADNTVNYALFLYGTPTIFVEAQTLGVSLDDRKPLLQTLNYANAAGVDWCVLTNGAEWRIYKVHAPVAAEEKLFLTARLDDPAAEPGPIAATLSLLLRDRMWAPKPSPAPPRHCPAGRERDRTRPPHEDARDGRAGAPARRSGPDHQGPDRQRRNRGGREAGRVAG